MLMMKEMYVIEKELHHIGGIEIKIANADLLDAGSWEKQLAAQSRYFNAE